MIYCVSIYRCMLLCMNDVIFMNEKHGPVGCDDLLFRFFRFRTDVSSWIVSDSSHVVWVSFSFVICYNTRPSLQFTYHEDEEKTSKKHKPLWIGWGAFDALGMPWFVLCHVEDHVEKTWISRNDPNQHSLNCGWNPGFVQGLGASY